MYSSGNFFRPSHRVLLVAAAALLGVTAFACSATDVPIGEQSSRVGSGSGSGSGGSASPDGGSSALDAGPHSCPMESPPAPGFCAGGTIVPNKDAMDCITGYDCVYDGGSGPLGDGGPQPCPEITPPSPSFCPNGTIVPNTDAFGCVRGYDCVQDAGASNACTAAGNHCVGIFPGACTNWSSLSCGGGVGVGCCAD